MKFLDKIKSSKAFKKVVAVIASASMAASMLAVNAFAAEGGTGGTPSVAETLGEIGPKLLAGFGDIISACIDIGVSVIPLGLSIFGALKLWDVCKKFFVKATG